MSIIVKAGTKKAEDLLARANNFLGTDLFDVYDSVSAKKYNAWKDCKNWCEADNGTNFRITAASSWRFSVAWELDYAVDIPDDENNTVCRVTVPATRIETKDNSYIILHKNPEDYND